MSTYRRRKKAFSHIKCKWSTFRKSLISQKPLDLPFFEANKAVKEVYLLISFHVNEGAPKLEFASFSIGLPLVKLHGRMESQVHVS
jgi:hypothetical protein